MAGPDSGVVASEVASEVVLVVDPDSPVRGVADLLVDVVVVRVDVAPRADVVVRVDGPDQQVDVVARADGPDQRVDAVARADGPDQRVDAVARADGPDQPTGPDDPVPKATPIASPAPRPWSSDSIATRTGSSNETNCPVG